MNKRKSRINLEDAYIETLDAFVNLREDKVISFERFTKDRMKPSNKKSIKDIVREFRERLKNDKNL